MTPEGKKVFAGLIGTVIGGVILYYLPGIVSKIARGAGKYGNNLADHLDRDFPDGKVNFGNKENS